MMRGRPLLQWVGSGFLAAVMLIWGQGAWAAAAAASPATPGKPDLIRIETLAAYGKLELPPVTFFHDKHTKALAKENKSCEACHQTVNQQLQLTFMRPAGAKPENLKEIYHTNCIGCHQQTAAAGKPSGPLDGFCRSCHNAKPPAPGQLEAGMDKILHARHLNPQLIPAPEGGPDNCSRCHHVYDQQAKKLVYVKGQEGSCRYCHGEHSTPTAISYRQAAHQQCVLCHLNLAQQQAARQAPVTCGACHGAAGQAQIAKKNQEWLAQQPQQQVPRLKRGQPDATLITYQGKAEAKGPSLPPVAFDHKAHEQYTDSCRTCHHASLDSCSSCHTLGGSAKGGMVTYEQAMHRPTSDYSCLGCHQKAKEAANCAACHARLAQASQPDPGSCQQCHKPIPGGIVSPSQKAALAETLLSNRTLTAKTYATGEIPDKVKIDLLSKKYEPVEMAHRRHMEAILKGVKDSKLAAAFHSDPGTLCQGCHHHSPASKEPPRCVNCHPQTEGVAAYHPGEPSRPGLKAAYHGQCMDCHQILAVKPVATACTDCHKEKPTVAMGAKGATP